jgi:hypothetical protein
MLGEMNDIKKLGVRRTTPTASPNLVSPSTATVTKASPKSIEELDGAVQATAELFTRCPSVDVTAPTSKCVKTHSTRADDGTITPSRIKAAMNKDILKSEGTI